MSKLRFKFKRGRKFVAKRVATTMRLMKANRFAWTARAHAWKLYLKARKLPRRRRAVVYRRWRVLKWIHMKALRALRRHQYRVRRSYRAWRYRIRKIRFSYRLARRVARGSRYARATKRRALLKIRRFVAKRRIFRRLIRKVRRVTFKARKVVGKRRWALRRRHSYRVRRYTKMIRIYWLRWRKAGKSAKKAWRLRIRRITR